MDADERTLWEGHASHVKDLGYHALCALLSPLLVPLVLMLVRWLDTRCHRWEVTSERIRTTTGILSKRMEEIELYRVKDTSIEEPFLYRLFRRGTIVIETSDRSSPELRIEAIAGARELREQIRGCVEKIRERKGVREIDYR